MQSDQKRFTSALNYFKRVEGNNRLAVEKRYSQVLTLYLNFGQMNLTNEDIRKFQALVEKLYPKDNDIIVTREKVKETPFEL